MSGILFPLFAMALLQASGPTPTPVDPPEQERKICRSAERQLGSRVVRPRRCKTASEWAEDDAKMGGLPLSAIVTEGQAQPGQGTRPQ